MKKNRPARHLGLSYVENQPYLQGFSNLHDGAVNLKSSMNKPSWTRLGLVKNHRFPSWKLALTVCKVSNTAAAPSEDHKSLVTEINMNHAPLQIKICGHVFGEPCLREWLDRANTCPICRKRLFEP
jgi:hypothetical protein